MIASIEIRTNISRPGYSIDKIVLTHCEFTVIRQPFAGSYRHSIMGKTGSTVQSDASDFATLILEAHKAHGLIVERELQGLIDGDV